MRTPCRYRSKRRARSALLTLGSLGLLANCVAATAPTAECPTCLACPAQPVAGTASAPPAASHAAATIPVELPSAADLDRQSVFAIELTATGDVLVTGQVTTETDLMALVRAARQKESALRVLIVADQKVNWGRVIRVMDLAKQQGATRFAFGVSARAP